MRSESPHHVRPRQDFPSLLDNRPHARDLVSQLVLLRLVDCGGAGDYPHVPRLRRPVAAPHALRILVAGEQRQRLQANQDRDLAWDGVDVADQAQAHTQGRDQRAVHGNVDLVPRHQVMWQRPATEEECQAQPALFLQKRQGGRPLFPRVAFADDADENVQEEHGEATNGDEGEEYVEVVVQVRRQTLCHEQREALVEDIGP
mmetsp:Transcript_18802/g.37917  ORF Transcript_18802/g.37917 Transcript_18802/m.37917 type:complete len:202 (-) Transcript_18802:1924-2529(-)